MPKCHQKSAFCIVRKSWSKYERKEEKNRKSWQKNRKRWQKYREKWFQLLRFFPLFSAFLKNSGRVDRGSIRGASDNFGQRILNTLQFVQMNLWNIMYWYHPYYRRFQLSPWVHHSKTKRLRELRFDSIADLISINVYSKFHPPSFNSFWNKGPRR